MEKLNEKTSFYLFLFSNLITYSLEKEAMASATIVAMNSLYISNHVGLYTLTSDETYIIKTGGSPTQAGVDITHPLKIPPFKNIEIVDLGGLQNAFLLLDRMPT